MRCEESLEWFGPAAGYVYLVAGLSGGIHERHPPSISIGISPERLLGTLYGCDSQTRELISEEIGSWRSVPGTRFVWLA
jgi:hypothetical protein